MRTYWEVVREAEQAFLSAGIENGGVDARYLLEFALKDFGISCNSSWYLLHRQEPIGIQEEAAFRELVQKRLKRIPLQHLTGEQEFMGFPFLVNEHVLIPRQDTEILVEEAVKRLHGEERILDLCTGSGCILISILKFGKNLRGVGVDLSEMALKVAEENKRNLNSDAKFIQSDLFEKVEGRFDMIVSNPPYIETEVIEGLESEVRDHEPRMALDGGKDGLFFYRKIAGQAGEYLNEGGWILFEIGCNQRKAVDDILREVGFLVEGCIKDYAGLDRVVIARKPENRK